MLEKGSAMYLLIPNASTKNIMHSGAVIESSAEGFVAQFDDVINPAVGADVNAYADVRGKFFQQGACVLEIRQAAPTIIAFARVGEPVSAENRQTFRVSVVTLDILAEIQSEKNCPVVDVGPEGFGAVTNQALQIGSVVQVAINFEGRHTTLGARVQTVKKRPDGKFRCGFFDPQKNSPTRKILQQISSAIQRAQLCRLAGAA